METSKVIGICGYARCGKDSLYNALEAHRGKRVHRIAFGDAIKEDLEEFIKVNFDIDIWTDNDDEKKLIRPIVLAYGNAKRSIDADYWIKRALAKVTEKTDHIYVFTDIRYERELVTVKGIYGYNTHIVYLEREGNKPANTDEELYVTPMVDLVDSRIWMPDYKGEGKLPRLSDDFFETAGTILRETSIQYLDVLGN